MEKVSDTHSGVTFSKTNEGYNKITLKIRPKLIFRLVCCFIFSQTGIFSAMSPFGIAFYGGVFTKGEWMLAFAMSCLGYITSPNGPFALKFATLVMITAMLGFFDTENQRMKKACIVAGSFLVLNLIYLAYSGYIIYDILALSVESAVIYALVYVFGIGFPVITSLKKRNFISASESICTVSFLALGTMALSGYPDFMGFSLSGTMAILLIYIFSLDGLNGGALVLSVLLGTIGSLKSESFSIITGTYAFGALLASALSRHGKCACVLGFVIANTFSSIILEEANVVAVNIYDSLGAALIFFLIPVKHCMYFSKLFSARGADMSCRSSLAEKSGFRTAARLDEMSKSFYDLAKIYSLSYVKRDLGKDYIFTKFNEVKSLACAGCTGNVSCFKTPSSKGYIHMSHMLETAFKNGKITPLTMPAEFKRACKRCDSFSEKFNAMFNVVKTERLWLSKLNDSRALISCQMEAIADALLKEKEKCMMTSDSFMEENLRAELDKLSLGVSGVVAQRDYDGNILIDISFGVSGITDEEYQRLCIAVEQITGKKVDSSYPKYNGGEYVVTFFTSGAYKVTAGFASKPKIGEKVSGDSIKLINPDGKNYYAVLSDGMGSGQNASAESSDTVLLMEKFINAGFDCDTAIKLINSSLLLRSAKDSFSTIDLCRVDLVSGEIHFKKLGAACSYIKKDGVVTTVSAGSLPAGILKDIETENHYMSIDSDTMVVLVSDGISDIELKNKDTRGWLKNELMKLKTNNPQIIASKLCERAAKLQEGSINDDMTVIVLNIKKRLT